MVEAIVETTSAGLGGVDSKMRSNSACSVAGGIGAVRLRGRCSAKRLESLRSARDCQYSVMWRWRYHSPFSDSECVSGTLGRLLNHEFDRAVRCAGHASSFALRLRVALPPCCRPLAVRGGVAFALSVSAALVTAAAAGRGPSERSPGGHDAFELESLRCCGRDVLLQKCWDDAG